MVWKIWIYNIYMPELLKFITFDNLWNGLKNMNLSYKYLWNAYIYYFRKLVIVATSIYWTCTGGKFAFCRSWAGERSSRQHVKIVSISFHAHKISH